MSRSLVYVVCCLAIIHSSLALPIVLPRDGVTEAKPPSVRLKWCLLLCGGHYHDYYDDNYDDFYDDDDDYYDSRPVHDWLDDVPDPPPDPSKYASLYHWSATFGTNIRMNRLRYSSWS
jgi:hypothetical protein